MYYMNDILNLFINEWANELYSNLRENSKTIDIRQTDLSEEIKFDKLAVKKIDGLQKKPRQLRLRGC